MSTNKPQFLIIHHTGGTDTNPKEDTSHHTFEVVNEWHKQMWNFKSSLGFFIGYQYFIDKTGKVTQGRADTDEGAHTIGKNLSSLGICLAGNFDVTEPTKEQIEALKTLCKAKMSQYSISLDNVVPHRKFAIKSCYGSRLSDAWIKNLLTDPAPTPVPVPTLSNDAIKDEIRTHITAIETLLGKIK